MSAAILAVHIIVCVVMILIILLQQGKGAEMEEMVGWILVLLFLSKSRRKYEVGTGHHGQYRGSYVRGH